jgi:hypothetical protein
VLARITVPPGIDGTVNAQIGPLPGFVLKAGIEQKTTGTPVAEIDRLKRLMGRVVTVNTQMVVRTRRPVDSFDPPPNFRREGTTTTSPGVESASAASARR